MQYLHSSSSRVITQHTVFSAINAKTWNNQKYNQLLYNCVCQ